MDVLTRLLQMARPQAALDLRCQFSGAYEIPNAASPDGSAPFHLVLSGSCRIEFDGGLLTARPGDFILFPRGGMHCIRDDGAQGERGAARMRRGGMLPLQRVGKGPVDVDLLCGHFELARGPGELLFKSLPDPLHVCLPGGEATSLLQPVVALMRREAEQRRPGALAVVTALSQALLAMALREAGERPGPRAGILALLADARLGASAQALLKEPGRAWTIEALAGLAAMSRAHYARRFREASGMTVFAFMTRARMAIACGLLRETRRTVGDIGMEVGYQSEAAFGKAFKQRIGEFPGVYRRRQAGHSHASH